MKSLHMTIYENHIATKQKSKRILDRNNGLMAKELTHYSTEPQNSLCYCM